MSYRFLTMKKKLFIAYEACKWQVNMIYIIYIKKDKQDMDKFFNTDEIWETPLRLLYKLWHIFYILTRKKLQKNHMLWCMEKSSMNIPLNFFFCDPGKKVIQVLNDIVHHYWSLSLWGELFFQKGTLIVQSYANARVSSSQGRWNVPLWSLIITFHSKFQRVNLHMIKYPINPSDHA